MFYNYYLFSFSFFPRFTTLSLSLISLLTLSLSPYHTFSVNLLTSLLYFDLILPLFYLSCISNFLYLLSSLTPHSFHVSLPCYFALSSLFLCIHHPVPSSISPPLYSTSPSHSCSLSLSFSPPLPLVNMFTGEITFS